jgi:hypothetical protein
VALVQAEQLRETTLMRTLKDEQIEFFASFFATVKIPSRGSVMTDP